MLIRTQAPDLIFVWQNLTKALLSFQDNTGSIKNVGDLRKKSLAALVIYRPVDVVGVLSDYFYGDCGLMDRIFILGVL